MYIVNIEHLYWLQSMSVNYTNIALVPTTATGIDPRQLLQAYSIKQCVPFQSFNFLRLAKRYIFSACIIAFHNSIQFLIPIVEM